MNVSTQVKKAKGYFIDQIPNWNALRVLGKSKVVSLTILMPFIGYLILFNQELSNYLELSKEILNITSESGQDKGLAISRLYYLYFGFMLIGFGSILFSICCPQYIKENNTEYEFVDRELSLASVSRFSKILLPFSDKNRFGKIHQKLGLYNKAFQAAKYEPDGDNVDYVLKRTGQLESLSAKGILGMVWHYYLDCKILCRATISLLYGTGLILVLIPSALVFKRVCEIVFS